MRPTYEQLVELNPLLAKKTREEFEQLVDIFEDYGYLWDSNHKNFYNKKSLNGFEHRAVTLYDQETLKKKLKAIVLDKIYNEVWRIGILKMAVITVIWIIGGWAFVTIAKWLLVMAGLLLLLFMFHYFTLNPPLWFPIPNRWKKGRLR